MPDYGRAEPAPPTAAEALRWVPRVLFHPAHVLVERVLRGPLVAVVDWGEEHHVFARLKRFFTWVDGQAGFFPTAFVEFGLNPHVGFYAYLENLLLSHHKLIVRAGFWSDQWIRLAAENRLGVFAGNTGSLVLRAEYTTRPDHLFAGVGLGPDGRSGLLTRYRETLLSVDAGLESKISGLNTVSFWLGFRQTRFGSGQGRSIEEVYDLTDPVLVPGFATYQLAEASAKLALDSRSDQRQWSPGTGLRLELQSALAVDPADSSLAFVRYGGELAGFWDWSGVNHVLGLRLHAEQVSKIGARPVPFTELTSFGGLEYLRGFLAGRLRGQSGAVVTADYRFPVWAFLDADMFVSAGGVFGPDFEGFAVDRTRLSWGFGLRSNNSRDVSFDMMLAFGSSRLDEGSLQVDRVHFVLGINQGY